MRGHVEGGDVGVGTFGHGDVGVGSFAHHHMLFGVSRRNGSAVGNLCSPFHGKGWGCNGDALQFAHEVAFVRGLVVAHRLPHHGVAILVVVPECIQTVLGGNGCSPDADAGVAGRTHHQFLAPVAKEVGNGTGIVFRRVVGVAVNSGEQSATGGFVDGSFACLAARTVHHLVEQVAVPIDTLVQMAPEESIVVS